MIHSTVRIATRKSKLALWQANHVTDLLMSQYPGLTVTLVPMMTDGDRWIDDPLYKLGGKGLFIKALEAALLEDRADIAVHSMKDLPYAIPKDFIVPVILERASPLDVLVTNEPCADIAELPKNAVIGTSSLRRQVQLAKARPDFKFTLLRGNVPTRLGKLHNKEYDAIVLAEAGLARLDLLSECHALPLAPTLMLPAVGQGAVGIECLAGNSAVSELLMPLHHTPTANCILAERAMNAKLGGGCHVAIAGYATGNASGIALTGRVGDLDHNNWIEASAESLDPQVAGLQVAQALLDQGAEALLQGQQGSD